MTDDRESVHGFRVSIAVSPDLGAYAAGELDASQVRCVLCWLVPCGCPPFGSDAHFALVDRAHGKDVTS